MNLQIIENIRNAVHFSSLLVIILAVLILLFGLVRPQFFKVVLRNFSKRGYIVAISVFVCLLSATTLLATQAPQPTYDSTKHNQSLVVTAPIPSSKNNNLAISIEEVAVTEPMAFTSQKQDDPNIPINQTKIMQAGEKGQKKRTYTVTKIADKETSRVLKNEIVVSEPKPEIVAVGTQAPTPPAAASAKPKAKRSSDECKTHSSQETQLPVCLSIY